MAPKAASSKCSCEAPFFVLNARRRDAVPAPESRQILAFHQERQRPEARAAVDPRVVEYDRHVADDQRRRETSLQVGLAQNGPAQVDEGRPLFLGNSNVQSEKDAGSRVDRHGGGNLGKVNALEQGSHIIQGGNGNADLANLTLRAGMIRIVPELSGKVEGDR